MRRKKERSKQGQTNKAKQHSTPNVQLNMYHEWCIYTCTTQHVSWMVNIYRYKSTMQNSTIDWRIHHNYKHTYIWSSPASELRINLVTSPVLWCCLLQRVVRRCGGILLFLLTLSEDSSLFSAVSQVHVGTSRALCLECGVSWVQIPPEAAHFTLEVTALVVACFVVHLSLLVLSSSSH